MPLTMSEEEDLEIEIEDTDFYLQSVPVATTFNRNLAEVTGGQKELIWQKVNGDQYGCLGVKQRFETDAELKEAFINAYPDEPLLLDDDTESVQGWTYVADYTIHPLSPACDEFLWYIHARINKYNELEFACFTKIHDEENSQSDFILSEVNGTSQDLVWQKLSGQQKPILQIAVKEEAEKKLLKNGKLIMSACPQYAGYWVNKSNAKYLHGRVSKGLRCYGHVWSYWYQIIDGVLYFVGLPLWTGNSSGHIKTTRSVSVPVPPTEYDLSYGLGDKDFVAAMSLVQNIWYQDGASGEESSLAAGAERILAKYGDRETETELVNVTLAKVENGSIEQYHRGDILQPLSAISIHGGVHRVDGKLKAISAYNMSINFEDERLLYKRAAQGFIPQKTKNPTDGMVALYEIFPTIYGTNLSISMSGPRFIRSAEWDGDYDFTLSVSPDNPEPGPDPDEPDPDEPDPDNPIPPTPNPPTPWPGPSPTPTPTPTPIPPQPYQTVNCGYWWTAGKGIQVDYVQSSKPRTFIGVDLKFKISVKENVKRTGTMLFETDLYVTSMGGGAYILPEDMGGGAAYLAYGVAGDGDIQVTNLSSAMSGSVSPEGTFTKNLKLTWHAKAKFGHTIKTNQQNTLASNFVTVTATGKKISKFLTVNYTSNTGKPNPVTIEAVFDELKVELNRAAVEEILKNAVGRRIPNPIMNAHLSPSSVRGSVSNTKTQAPQLFAAISAYPTRNKADVGMSQYTGEITLTPIDAKVDAGKLVYKVSNATTGWNEESKRGSCQISGAFTVTTNEINLKF